MKNYKSEKNCVSCGLGGDGLVCFHHVYSKKSHPEFKEMTWNLMSLCFKCHELIHRFGTTKMANLNPGVKQFLVDNGWQFFSNKWRHFENDLQ